MLQRLFPRAWKLLNKEARFEHVQCIIAQADTYRQTCYTFNNAVSLNFIWHNLVRVMARPQLDLLRRQKLQSQLLQAQNLRDHQILSSE